MNRTDRRHPGPRHATRPDGSLRPSCSPPGSACAGCGRGRTATSPPSPPASRWPRRSPADRRRRPTRRSRPRTGPVDAASADRAADVDEEPGSAAQPAIIPTGTLTVRERRRRPRPVRPREGRRLLPRVDRRREDHRRLRGRGAALAGRAADPERRLRRRDDRPRRARQGRPSSTRQGAGRHRRGDRHPGPDPGAGAEPARGSRCCSARPRTSATSSAIEARAEPPPGRARLAQGTARLPRGPGRALHDHRLPRAGARRAGRRTKAESGRQRASSAASRAAGRR